ncbi:MAG: hypothetical protein IH626_18215 [Rhodospirillales bacterium]|nr:hypothetical protein [Rhodospirillales bacterium]
MPSDAEAMAQADPANRDLALNTALETAYGAGKDAQFGDMAERIYAKNEADLDAFESDWRNLRTSALDNLAPSWKPIAEAEFDRRKALYVPRIAATIRTRIEDETNAGLRQAADTYTARAAAAAHDDDAAELAQTMRRFEATISARTDLAPEEKAKARADFQAGVATQVALGRFDRALKDNGLEGAAQFAEDFAHGAAGGGGTLAEAERAPIARALQAHLDDAREADAAAKAAAAASAKVESAKRLAAVEKSIGEHTYGLADLERDTQAGMFEGHPDAPARLSKSIETARKDRHAKTEAAARGAEAVAGGTPLDPADPQHVSAIDAWWDAHPDKGAAGAIEAARRTNILPGPARDAIADGLLYGTPEKRVEQARALVELIKAAPAAAGTLPAQLRAEAARIVKRLKQGHTPESATEGTDKALERVADVLAGGAGGDIPDDEQGANPPPVGDETTARVPSGPEAKAEAKGRPVAAPGTPAPWREILEVMDGGEGEAIQDLAGMIPEDPEDATDELIQALGELGLSLVPGVGEALSAKDAYQAIVAAREALKNDDLATAIEQGALAGMAGLGAIPGAGALARLGKGGVKVAQAVLKVLRSRASETVARVRRSTSDDWFVQWVGGVVRDPRTANHGAARVGQMQSKVRKFLKAKGVKAPSDGIGMTDDAIVHMTRSDKPLSKRVPSEMVEKIPEILRNPDEIFWELRHERGRKVHTLLYVRHLEGDDVVKAVQPVNDRNRAKFVVKVDVNAFFQRGDKRVQRRDNWVWSAGRVATGDLKSYERVWP